MIAKFAIYLLSLFCVATAASEINNQGNEFCIAVTRMPENSLFKPVTLVGTNSSSVVNFTTEYTNEQGNAVTVHRQTVRDNPYKLETFHVAAVESDSYTERNKGVCIISVDEQLYVVSYIKLDTTSSSSYLALPYQELLADQYEYCTLSTSSSLRSSSDDDYYSGFLLVGLRNNTSITIYPSIPLNITSDAQNATSVSILVSPGDNHTVILHRRQTLYIGKGDGADVTGTRIVSDKPLTVISGHEAGSVPSDGTLEPMAQQIPPTQLWGERFMIVPLEHPHGQIIKILSSVNNTAISYNCHQFSNQTVLLKAGSVEQFFVPASVYCYIETNNSVLIGQFPYSPSGNTDGDTTMILVASTDQYSNEFTFMALNNTLNDDIDYFITVAVPIEHFEETSILYDKEILASAEWSPIYNIDNDTLVGYGTSFSIKAGYHTVSHSQPNGLCFVIVYGFHNGRAYGYPAGFTFPNEKILDVEFSSQQYAITEGDGPVMIKLIGNPQQQLTTMFLVQTIQSPDSNEVIGYVNISTIASVTPAQSIINIPITITDNDLTEETEHFTVKACLTSKDLCLQTTVTIIDDDTLIITPSLLNYDKTNGELTVSCRITKGRLSTSYTVTVQLSVIITLIDENKNTSLANEMMFSSHQLQNQVNYHIQDIIGQQAMDNVVISAEIVHTEAQPISLVQVNNIKTESISQNLEKLIESNNIVNTITTTTPSSAANSNTVTSSSSPAKETTSSETTKTTETTTTTRSDSQTLAASTTSSALDRAYNKPSTEPLSYETISYKNVLIYVQIGCVVLVMALLGCIVSGITGIYCYRRGRQYLDQPRPKENRRSPMHRGPPEIVHTSLSITNPCFKVDKNRDITKDNNDVISKQDNYTNTNVVPCISSQRPDANQGMVLVRPRRSSRELDEDRYVMSASQLDEHLYKRISLHRKRRKASKGEIGCDLELTDKWASMSTLGGINETDITDSEMREEEDEGEDEGELTNSEMELAKKLGSRGAAVTTKTDCDESKL